MSKELIFALALVEAAQLAGFACLFLLVRVVVRDLRAENRALLDRWLASKNLPPVGVDLKAEHEERRAERKARRDDQTLKSAPDPTWKMRRALAEKEKKRLGGQK